MVSPQLLHLMEPLVEERGGDTHRVPLADYDAAVAETQRAAAAYGPALAPPDVLRALVADACLAIARRYPRPKPYAKKRAVR